MVRCVRIWTDAGGSSFQEGSIALPDGQSDDAIGATARAISVSFRETGPGHAPAWHDAPTRQLVLTLYGTLEFETRDGGHFVVRPGDVLLAEDTRGTGHVWRLVGPDPWRRAYVILADDAEVGFVPEP